MQGIDASDGRPLVSPAPPCYQVYACGPFLLKRWDGTSYQSVPVGAWGGSHSPRLLLKVLLASPERTASRGRLLEILWPSIEMEEAGKYLNDAAYRLRAVLRPTKGAESLLLTATDTGSYALVGQERLWVDADAALSLLEQAEECEQQGGDALPFLEEAAGYLSRGEFLVEEEHIFFYGRRARVARARRGCLLAQARVSAQRGWLRRGEALLSSLLEENPLDEDALGVLMLNLHQQGRTSEGLRLYEETRALLEREGVTPTEATRATEQRLRSDSPRGELLLADTTAPFPISSYPLSVLNCSESTGAPSPAYSKDPSNNLHPLVRNVTQGIIEREGLYEESQLSSSLFLPREMAAIQEAKESDDEPVNRREATRTIGVVGLQMLGLPVWEHLSKALKTSSFLDQKTLETCASLIENFWRLSETVTPSVLIRPVMGHFEMMTELLRGTPAPVFYQPLTSLTAEVAQIAARLLFDMKGYNASAMCYDISIELAQRANNPVLQAVGVARKARDLLQNRSPQKAYRQLQQAPVLSSQPGATIAGAYLAAVEAKALSQLGEAQTCTQKLEEAMTLVGDIQPSEDFYWTEFNASLLDDFRGDCYLQLHQFSTAQAVFQEALELGRSSSLRHQSSVTIGLANAVMQQGEIEQSCALASRALHLTAQTQSWMILQYIHTFRGQLGPWKNESCVKDLDEQIAYVSINMPKYGK